mgnify:CR=1 FL=1
MKDVVNHPAFRNSARSIARLYDTLHDAKYKEALTTETDTGSGSYTHKFFRASRSAEELLEARNAIATWSRLTYGQMGRTPDYKASFLATMGGNPEYYAPYHENAIRWYKKAQEKVLFFNHAIVNPPVDRNRPVHEVADVFVHVEKETDQALWSVAQRWLQQAVRLPITILLLTTGHCRCKKKSLHWRLLPR